MTNRDLAAKVPISARAKSGNVLRVGGVVVGPAPGNTFRNLDARVPIATSSKAPRLARRRPFTGKAASANSAFATTASLQVDLSVTALTANPTTPTAGDSMVFTVTVRNNSTTAVPANTNIGVGIYLDGATPPNVITYTNMRDGLAGGASFTLDTVSGWAPGGVWTATEGTHTIRAWVDDAGLIPESNEANNTRDISITVAPGAAPSTGSRLFRDTSAWNATKSPGQFTYVANADSFLASQNYGINNGPGFYTPCYFGQASDPIQTLHVGQGWGYGVRNVTGRAPANMVSPAGGDGNMDIIFAPGSMNDLAFPGATGLDCYQARYQGNNVWNVAMAVPFDAYGGFGFAQPDKNNWTPQGTTAIGCCQAGGAILAQDIARGSIPHGIRIAFNYDQMGGINGQQCGYAISNDVGPSHGGANNPMLEGALLMPVGAEPSGLGFWGHQLWLAMVTYGVWVTDKLDGIPLIFGDGSSAVIGAFGSYQSAEITAICRKLRLTNVGFNWPMPW